VNWPFEGDLSKQFPLSLEVCVLGVGRKKGVKQVVPGFQLVFHK